MQPVAHKVLLVGSGLMTKPLINYMTSFGDTHITIASNIIEDAKRLEKLFPGKTTAAYLDLFDS